MNGICPTCKTTLIICNVLLIDFAPINAKLSEQRRLCNNLRCPNCGYIPGQCPKTSNHKECHEQRGNNWLIVRSSGQIQSPWDQVRGAQDAIWGPLRIRNLKHVKLRLEPASTCVCWLVAFGFPGNRRYGVSRFEHHSFHRATTTENDVRMVAHVQNACFHYIRTRFQHPSEIERFRSDSHGTRPLLLNVL